MESSQWALKSSKYRFRLLLHFRFRFGCQRFEGCTFFIASQKAHTSPEFKVQQRGPMSLHKPNKAVNSTVIPLPPHNSES